MDLRQLNALVAVADHGTFSAAADALNTVQSNVSTHVARLERELGAPLVDRAAGRLTDEGRAVVARARRVASELDAIVADVTSMGSEVRGGVRLGVIGTTGRWLVPRLLRRLPQRHPGVRLTVVDATTTTLEPQLVSGRLDIAVVTLPVPGVDLTTAPLFDEDLVLVVPDGHPLGRRDQVSMGELDGLELLLPAVGTTFRSEIDAATGAAGITMHPTAELDGVRLLASLTLDGYGPAILPATATAAPAWHTGRSPHCLRVEGLPRRRIGLAQIRQGHLSAPARACATVLAEVVAEGTVEQAGLHPPASGQLA